MKKRLAILRWISLAAAVLVFCGYWIYSNGRDDSVGPVFTVASGLLEISVSDPESALLQGITAVDDVDGDVTASILVESMLGITGDHVVTVTYAAFDRSGNVSKIQRQVRLRDYESPRFTLDRSLSFPAGSTFDLSSSIGAVDMVDGDIRRRVRATLTSDTGYLNEEGTHQVLLQVTNTLGDVAMMTVPVEVYPAGTYNATLKLKQYIVYLPKGAIFDPYAYLDDFAYPGETLKLSGEIPPQVSVDISGTVDSGREGVYSVSYTASLIQGNNKYAGYAKLIVMIEQ